MCNFGQEIIAVCSGTICPVWVAQYGRYIHYGHLWQIEKAFRISKADLKIRPIYHRLQHRIETHICISFVAYKIYKELERQLKEKQSNVSSEKAIEIAKTIYQVKAKTQNGEVSHIMLITDEQKFLAQLFKFG